MSDSAPKPSPVEKKLHPRPGKISNAAKSTLQKNLSRRLQRDVLVDRFIIRDNASTGRLFANASKLDSLLQTRPARDKLMSLNVIQEDDSARAEEKKQKQTGLSNFLTNRLSPESARAKGFFKGTPDGQKKYKAIHEARQKLGDLLLHRPAPEKLVETAVVPDIGHLPTPEEMKDQGNQLEFKEVGLSDAVSVECGWAHTTVMTQDGSVYTFGSGLNGRLGHGNNDALTKPTKVEALGKVSAISCGDNHSAAIVDGVVHVWGVGSWGRLGTGSQDDVSTPKAIDVGESVVQVSCGGYHTLLLTASGKVYSFGWNKNGRLGLGSDQKAFHVATPCLVKGLDDVEVSSVHAGQSHSLILSKDGNVYSFGSGLYGLLGHGDKKERNVPTRVESLLSKNIVSVSAGAFHSLALDATGRVFSWGYNKRGQLGVGESRDESKPMPTQVDVSEVKGSVSFVYAGKSSSLLIADGQLYTWGHGTRGILGHGNEDNETAPKAVASLQDHKVMDAVLGFVHSAIVLDSGKVMTVGGLSDGKLGY